MTDTELTDAQYRLVSTLHAMAQEKPGEVPSNRLIAERCGWLHKGTGRPAVSKVKRIVAELVDAGVITRDLESDGRRVRRISIKLARPGFEPPPSETPAQIQATPAHWVDHVRREVMVLLSAVASEGPAILRERLLRVAGLVQAELAGRHVGNGSDLFVTLVEAVAFGFDPAAVDAAIVRAGEGRCPRCRADIRGCVRDLMPDPRAWLQRLGKTAWPSRDAQSRGWY
jgi:hypothetical protein